MYNISHTCYSHVRGYCAAKGNWGGGTLPNHSIVYGEVHVQCVHVHTCTCTMYMHIHVLVQCTCTCTCVVMNMHVIWLHVQESLCTCRVS